MFRNNIAIPNASYGNKTKVNEVQDIAIFALMFGEQEAIVTSPVDEKIDTSHSETEGNITQ
jgi:hypothetical protein